MKLFLLFLCLFVATVSVRAASFVEGRIYLKNGSVVECTGDDRLQLPKKSGKLKIFRDAFRKTKTKEVLPAGDIDSVICWHAKTSHITACVYSKKGYYVDTNGGMLVRQRSGWFSSSRVAYFLQKHDESEFQDIGSTYRRSKDVFRERIARYIDDDPELAERIRRSNAYRDKTILMLQDYDPTKY